MKRHNLWDSPSAGQRPRFKPPTVQVGGSNVEVVDIFTYLGSQLHSSGGLTHFHLNTYTLLQSLPVTTKADFLQ